MTDVMERPAQLELCFDEELGELPRGQIVRVRIGSLDFYSRFRRRLGSPRLLVRLLGPLSPGSSAPILKGHVHPPGFHLLTISDPSLLLDPALRNGVFLGREDQDPIEGVARIVTAVAGQVGVSVEDVLFYGASGSGVAGCMAALRLGARCIAVNAQLDLYAARSLPPAAIFHRIFNPNLSAEDSLERYPERLRVSAAYAAAKAAGRSPRLVILQARTDRFHVRTFYRPFCAEMGLNPDGGVSADGGLRVAFFDDPGGHKIQPERAEALIQQNLHHLYPEAPPKRRQTAEPQPMASA